MGTRPAIVGRGFGGVVEQCPFNSVNTHQRLLTPPEPPSVTSADASKHQPSSATPSGRSVSTTRASRLSAPLSEKSHSTKPVRSSSATHPSISNTSSSNSKTSIPNTSLASVTSRPSTPGNIPATVRASRQSPARSATPVKTRPPPTSAGVKTARNNCRPSTPTSRPQLPSNSNPNVTPPLASRPNSRPSTPTRRPLAPTVGRDASLGQIPKPTSRPSSPGPRARAAVRPTDQMDFPTVAPPNLRPKQPERPTSAGRTRQGAALTARTNMNLDTAAGSLGLGRRQSLPGCNGHGPEGEFQRPNKVATATESTGFGRMMSKSSLDMALRHMDIRQGMGGIRGSSLFPHSIRSAAPKCREDRVSDPVVPAMTGKAVSENGSCNVTNSPDCNTIVSGRGGVGANSSASVAREGNTDVLGSYRYDAMLLTEDSKDMSWLHSTGDNSEQSPLFDHRFEPLPEPFGFV